MSNENLTDTTPAVEDALFQLDGQLTELEEWIVRWLGTHPEYRNVPSVSSRLARQVPLEVVADTIDHEVFMALQRRKVYEILDAIPESES